MAEADRTGRLVVLPCKVGQRVFALLDTDKHLSECEVKQIGLGNEIGFVGIEPIGARGREYGVSIKGFGKTVIPDPRRGGESIGGNEEWQLANQSAKRSIESMTAIVRIVGAKSLTRICR